MTAAGQADLKFSVQLWLCRAPAPCHLHPQNPWPPNVGCPSYSGGGPFNRGGLV